MPYGTRIDAGKLRHPIKIMDLTNKQDKFGDTAIDVGTPFATVWASVESLTGRELFAAQQRISEVTHKITMRWLDGVKANQMIYFDDRQFQIQAVQNPDERHKMLILLCIERDDSAREEGGSAA